LEQRAKEWKRELRAEPHLRHYSARHGSRSSEDRATRTASTFRRAVGDTPEASKESTAKQCVIALGASTLGRTASFVQPPACSPSLRRLPLRACNKTVTGTNRCAATPRGVRSGVGDRTPRSCYSLNPQNDQPESQVPWAAPHTSRLQKAKLRNTPRNTHVSSWPYACQTIPSGQTERLAIRTLCGKAEPTVRGRAARGQILWLVRLLELCETHTPGKDTLL